MDDRNDFGDRQPLPGHCAVRLDIPENLPAKFRRPAQYILATVRRSFKILHAFFYERCVVLIAPDSLDNRIRQFTAELLATMTQTTKTFRLRAEGLAALSRPLVAELVSPLGEIIELKMNSTTSDDYADTATIIVRQSVSWNCPKALPFRAYGLDLEAKLSVTPENTERPPPRAKARSQARCPCRRPRRWLASRQTQAQSHQKRALPRLCARCLWPRRQVHLPPLQGGLSGCCSRALHAYCVQVRAPPTRARFIECDDSAPRRHPCRRIGLSGRPQPRRPLRAAASWPCWP